MTFGPNLLNMGNSATCLSCRSDKTLRQTVWSEKDLSQQSDQYGASGSNESVVRDQEVLFLLCNIILWIFFFVHIFKMDLVHEGGLCVL